MPIAGMPFTKLQLKIEENIERIPKSHPALRRLISMCVLSAIVEYMRNNTLTSGDLANINASLIIIEKEQL